jgi:hypothetical protein
MTEQISKAREAIDPMQGGETKPELVKQYEDLERRWKPFEGDRPGKLPLPLIALLPDLFQPRRGICENHVGDLRRVLVRGAELDPVVVLPVAGQWVLLDGHHRVEAYRRERGGKALISVEVFMGTPKEALMVPGRRNSKAKLPMSGAERSEEAWKHVRMGRLTIKETEQTCGVGHATVSRMGKRKRELIAEGKDPWDTSWRALLAGRKDMDDSDREAWVDAQVVKQAEKLHKAFGSSLTANVEIAAGALEKHFGRNLGDLVRELKQRVPREEWDEGDEDPDF